MSVALTPWGRIGALAVAATGDVMATTCAAGALAAMQISSVYAGTPVAWTADRLARDLRALGEAWMDVGRPQGTQGLPWTKIAVNGSVVWASPGDGVTLVNDIKVIGRAAA